MRAEQSRTIRLAAKAARASESELEHRLNSAVTHIRVDSRLPGALTCAQVLLATLLRGPGQVWVDERDLTTDELARLRQTADTLRPGVPLRTGPPPRGATSIALGQRPGDIQLTPDGHGTHLHRSGASAQQRTPSMLGVLLAASFAAGEAFKDAAQISEQHCVRHEHLAFCPVTLSPELTAAPPTPAGWEPRLTLAGIGAIGSAHALLLAGLASSGGVVLIDRQTFAPENLGTYTLGEHSDVDAQTAKVKIAQRVMPGWRQHPHEGDIASAVRAIDTGQLPWTPFTLAGLDSREARLDAQRLQSDRLLDAATGDTAVGLRDTRPEGPCLACMLGTRAGPAPSKALTDLGIPLALANAPGEAVVDEQLIAAAPTELARAILTAQRGKPICGLLRAAGLTDLGSDGYMPSVPFVSQQAACLTVGRMLAIETAIDTQLPNFFQYDALIGPNHATRQNRRSDPACVCQQRAETIRTVRCERRAGPPA